MSKKLYDVAYWLVYEMEENISLHHAEAAVEEALKEDDPDFILIYLDDHKFHRPSLREKLHAKWNEVPEEKDEETHSITWKQLGQEISRMPKEFLNQTVSVNNCGSDTIAECLKYGRFGPYLKGF